MFELVYLTIDIHYMTKLAHSLLFCLTSDVTRTRLPIRIVSLKSVIFFRDRDIIFSKHIFSVVRVILLTKLARGVLTGRISAFSAIALG